MNNSLPPKISQLIDHFARLPSIGQKTATRLVLGLIKNKKQDIQDFGNALSTLHEHIHYCEQCFHFSQANICDICQDPKRESHRICIVESAMDLIAIERTHSYFGKYFVLGGVLSPIDGMGPKEVRLPELKKRFETDTTVTEIIFALPATLEGEATANMISEIAKSFEHIHISRIARGIPLGSAIEYTDERTLARAFEGRQQY